MSTTRVFHGIDLEGDGSEKCAPEEKHLLFEFERFRRMSA
jgi:hypothetical protein